MPNLKLSDVEIRAAFEGSPGNRFPPLLNVKQVAELLQLSAKTIYEWIGKGRLDGAFRRRGKHNLFFRDRVISTIFNGKEWTS